MQTVVLCNSSKAPVDALDPTYRYELSSTPIYCAPASVQQAMATIATING
jgi:hypothetical protein